MKVALTHFGEEFIYHNITQSNMFKRIKTFMSGSATETQTSSTGTALPRIIHKTIPLDRIRKRLVIIGDLHGCLDELKALLAKVNYSPDTTTVILVGDLTVKGPLNVATIRFLRDNPDIHALRGNHEDNILIAHKDKESKYGTRKVYSFVSDLSSDDIQYIQELPVTIRIPELKLLVVHAGVDPTVTDPRIEVQEFKHLIRIRCIDKKGKATKDAPSESEGKVLWGPLYKGPPYVVFGHDAKRGFQTHPWAKGLDSGCVYGNQLSALVIDDTRDVSSWWSNAHIVSVNAARQYASEEDDE
jgi:predicted phosphodiesterase